MKLTLLLGLLATTFSVQAATNNCTYKTEEEFEALTTKYDVTLTINAEVIIPAKDNSNEDSLLWVIMKSKNDNPRRIKHTPVKVTRIWSVPPHGPYKSDTVVFTMDEGSQMSEVAVYSQGDEHAMDQVRNTSAVTLTCTPKKVLDVSMLMKNVIDGRQCAQDA